MARSWAGVRAWRLGAMASRRRTAARFMGRSLVRVGILFARAVLMRRQLAGHIPAPAWQESLSNRRRPAPAPPRAPPRSAELPSSSARDLERRRLHRLRFRGQREYDREARPFADPFALGGDLPVVEIDDVPGDGQPEPQAAAFGRSV